MEGLLRIPEIEVLAGNLQVVVMSANVFHALALQFGNCLGMKDKLLEGAYYAFFGWLDIDDGTELGLAYNLVVLWLAAANADDSFLHGFEGIHRGSIGVELVQDGIGILHQLGVLAERNAFDDLKLHEVGMTGLHLSGCLEHDVGAFVGGALAVDADEDAHGMVCLGRETGGRTDGEGNKGGLVGEMGLIAAPVFVESGDDAVAVVGDDAVQLLLPSGFPTSLAARGWPRHWCATGRQC